MRGDWNAAVDEVSAVLAVWVDQLVDNVVDCATTLEIEVEVIVEPVRSALICVTCVLVVVVTEAMLLFTMNTELERAVD